MFLVLVLVLHHHDHRRHSLFLLGFWFPIFQYMRRERGDLVRVTGGIGDPGGEGDKKVDGFTFAIGLAHKVAAVVLLGGGLVPGDPDCDPESPLLPCQNYRHLNLNSPCCSPKLVLSTPSLLLLSSSLEGEEEEEMKLRKEENVFS